MADRRVTAGREEMICLPRRYSRGIIAGVMLTSLCSLTGCQVDVGGQTLPSPYYLMDDVQYFPPGPEFKLANEAAAMKAFQEGDGEVLE